MGLSLKQLGLYVAFLVVGGGTGWAGGYYLNSENRADRPEAVPAALESLPQETLSLPFALLSATTLTSLQTQLSKSALLLCGLIRLAPLPTAFPMPCKILCSGGSLETRCHLRRKSELNRAPGQASFCLQTGG